MLYDLMHHDISGVDLSKFPRTNALMDQIVSSMSPVQKFWYQRLKEGSLCDDEDQWNESIETKKFYQNYVDYVKMLGVKYPIENDQFGKQLRKLCPGVIRGKTSNKTGYPSRRPIYKFPKLEECRDEFEKRVRMPIDWDE